MKKNLLYRFCKGYAFGYFGVCGLFLLPAAGTMAQLLLGISGGIILWTLLKERSEESE
jgi:hypothetical protein